MKRADGERLAVGPVAGRDGPGRLHQSRRARMVRRQARRAARTWASTASRPTSASASRPTSCGTTAPTRSGCTTTTRYLYNKTVFDLLSEAPRRGRRGRVRALRDGRRPDSSRCIGAATRRPPSSRWPRPCAAGSRSGCRGFGFWSHDIGGFEGTPDAAVFKRWIAFGLLSSHSRLHGSTSYRVPWLFDDESVDVMRRFVRLKNRLMPYLFQAAGSRRRRARR